MIKVTVKLYGILAEIAGKPSLILENVSDSDDLKKHLLYLFPEMREHTFIVAVNNKLINKPTKLTNGDEIAVMPPFSGG